VDGVTLQLGGIRRSPLPNRLLFGSRSTFRLPTSGATMTIILEKMETVLVRMILNDFSFLL
jgi:hypothetical protein